MKRVAYYITGHGYGHTTRSIEVIRHLLRRHAQVSVVTDAPQWLFPDAVRQSVDFVARSCDIGAVQDNSFSVDVQGTLETVGRFYGSFASRVPEEAAFLSGDRIDVVAGDIPALAFLAADAAGVPSVAIANFSWDWIYGPYVLAHPEYAWIVAATQDAYRKAGLLLRLPFHGDLSAFPLIRDIPLIAGRPGKGSEAIRREFGTTPDDTVILVVLRQADLDKIDTAPLARLGDYKFVFLNAVTPAANFIQIPHDACAAPDMVSACDLVVSKPGYGIIAECAAAGTPILCSTRTDFLEAGVLTAGIENLGMGVVLAQERMTAGDWGDGITAALGKKGEWAIPDAGGAAVAAEAILELTQ